MRWARLAAACHSTTQVSACNCKLHCLMQMAHRLEVGTPCQAAAEPRAGRPQSHNMSSCRYRTLPLGYDT